MARARKELAYPHTKWVGIHLPLEFDKEVVSIQHRFEDAGQGKPSKADICVQLIGIGLGSANFDNLPEMQPELPFKAEEKLNKRKSNVEGYSGDRSRGKVDLEKEKV